MTARSRASGIVRAPFTFTGAAIRQIAWIRAQYAENWPDDPPVMLGVVLGGPLLEGGGVGPLSVAVAFWRASEFKPEARSLVQTVSGLDLVFPVSLAHQAMFVGKEIDYSDDRAFYLRRRVAGETGA